MGTDAIEEPPIVRHDENAAGEAVNGILEASKRVHVEVVRRLVEQQDVEALFQDLNKRGAEEAFRDGGGDGDGGGGCYEHAAGI